MVTWNNKLVTVLSGGNSIKFRCHRDFESFKSRMAKIGLDFSKYYFDELVQEAQYDAHRHNRAYELGYTILVSYDNAHGFQCGWKSEAQSEEWYGMKPFTWNEIKEELKTI